MFHLIPYQELFSIVSSTSVPNLVYFLSKNVGFLQYIAQCGWTMVIKDPCVMKPLRCKLHTCSFRPFSVIAMSRQNESSYFHESHRISRRHVCHCIALIKIRYTVDYIFLIFCSNTVQIILGHPVFGESC